MTEQGRPPREGGRPDPVPSANPIRKAPTVLVQFTLNPDVLRHSAEILADYALVNRDSAVAALYLDILGALEAAGEREGAAGLVKVEVAAVYHEEQES